LLPALLGLCYQQNQQRSSICRFVAALMNKEDDDKTWEEKITRIGGSMLDALSDSNKAGKR